MPSRGALLHFTDIVDAVLWIERYVEGLTFEQYEEDTKTRDAVERRLQIVTEAVIRLHDDAKFYSQEVEWSDWRGLGNILRHGYHKIDDRIIWRKIHKDLPTLKRAAIEAIAQLKA
jgi:uncharacterized protein with HEPN domain